MTAIQLGFVPSRPRPSEAPPPLKNPFAPGLAPAFAPASAPEKAPSEPLAPPHNAENEVNRRILAETLRYIQEKALPRLAIFPAETKATAPLGIGKPEIRVLDATTFQAAQMLVEQGHRPLVLNMANATRPGGHVLEGARAQEETLCRQSDLYPALQIAFLENRYPLPDESGLVVKNVLLFRDDSYAFLERPFQVDVFASAAYDCNPDHKPGKNLRGYDRPPSDEEYETGTKAKMRAMLRSAKHHCNDSLVLSAFGCGAFQNDPYRIATWYKQVLRETEFAGAFRTIVFAIPKGKNFDVFLSALK